MIKDWYVIKSASEKKDSSWKVFAITIVYYYEKNDKFTSSQTFSIEDFKKLYGDLNINGLVWQRIKIKEELILK